MSLDSQEPMEKEKGSNRVGGEGGREARLEEINLWSLAFRFDYMVAHQ